MKKAITACVFAVAALVAAAIPAAQETVTGTWTMTIESLPMRFVLEQKDTAVTGTLDYPHGAPFKLKGAFTSGTLTFSSDTDSAENFSVHIDGTGSFTAGGSLEGSIKAHFIERDDAGKVVRTRDQVMMWTATRAGGS